MFVCVYVVLDADKYIRLCAFLQKHMYCVQMW